MYELTPRYDCRKSFYGKALVIETPRGVFLRSYDTIVCGIVPAPDGGLFVRFWDDWSVTTARHIREFCRQNDFPAISSREWNELPAMDARGFGVC